MMQEGALENEQCNYYTNASWLTHSNVIYVRH